MHVTSAALDHEADSQYADEDLEVAPGHADGGLRRSPRADAIDAELGNWFDRALAGVDESAAPPPSQRHQRRRRLNGRALRAGQRTGKVLPQRRTILRLFLANFPKWAATKRDGTTYVMFSDGSIEAQSEQGVYRFGSMAELKAFFEDQSVAQ